MRWIAEYLAGRTSKVQVDGAVGREREWTRLRLGAAFVLHLSV